MILGHNSGLESRQTGTPQDQPGDASVDPTIESGECPVECRTDPWARSATWLGASLPRHDSQVYGEATRRPGEVPELADVFA